LTADVLKNFKLILMLCIIGSALITVSFGLQSSVVIQSAGTVRNQSQASFGVVTSIQQKPAVSNFYWLFGNESINYQTLQPSEVQKVADLVLFDGLVIWTNQGGYNIQAIIEFAKTKVVIADIKDFCSVLYPSLNSYTRSVTAITVTYMQDWGNFRNGDVVDIRNETSGTNKLTAVLASGLSSFSNITTISCYDTNNIAYFYMKGETENSGFYVMDLDATTPETEWTGIWHIFPAVKKVTDFPTGTYTRWMANGQNWWDLNQVYNHIDAIVAENSPLTRKIIIGHSVQGREIPAIFIGNGTKTAIIDGSIHGNEKSVTFAALRTAKLLTDYYHTDPCWTSKLTEYTIIIIPVLNPDGFVLNTRENANGVNLNRQFPPEGTTTQPEAWALRDLMAAYPPTIYVNMHEGYHYYPLHMIYGAYETSATKTLTINALKAANETFVGLNQYGLFTEQGSNAPINKVNTISIGGGVAGMASDYASYTCGTSATILETFEWSQTWDARKSLWALDYYPCVTLSFIQNLQR
jgi:hypothetical protein